MLRPLPRALLAPPARRPALRAWAPLGVAIAAAAAFALWVRPEALTSLPLPAARVGIKGGELSLQLVREHRGERARDADRFEPGDRFQALVSCPPHARWHWQLVVRQAGEIYLPLTASAPLVCANGVTLPGAFALDGSDLAEVCVVLSDSPVTRDQLAAAGLPAESACVTVEPDLP